MRFAGATTRAEVATGESPVGEVSSIAPLSFERSGDAKEEAWTSIAWLAVAWPEGNEACETMRGAEGLGWDGREEGASCWLVRHGS